VLKAHPPLGQSRRLHCRHAAACKRRTLPIVD
jgi:hypothetical protein